jgi:hypothetical protein
MRKVIYTLKGPGYNFTLNDVVAHDRPTKFEKKYFDPVQITIPQFNFHFGYFIKDNSSISLGWDHMKYVMDIPQVVKISVTINSSISDPAIPTGTYSGVSNNQDFKVNPEMLRFEHTDGFNYLSTDIERQDDIWVSKAKNSTLTLEIGAGLGVILPRTDVRLFEVGQNNYWNLAGYGVSAKTGLKYYFNKKLYLQNNLKVGWANLPNIHTTGRNEIDKADQQISYLENYTVLGFQF